jgi:hypothetical protein
MSKPLWLLQDSLMHVKGMLRPWFSGRIKSLRSNEKLKVKN